jgi:hypothetical protein
MQRKYLSLLGMLLAAWLGGPLLAATGEAVDPQRRFAEALEAIEADRLRSARELLRGLLDDYPSLLRARLELARVHYLSAEYEAARREAEQVLADPELPPQVQVTVLAFLAQIEADRQRRRQPGQWGGSLYAGLMYDTNVNFGPSRDIIDIGGIGFRPDRREEDLALVVSPTLSHLYDPQRRFSAGEYTGAFTWQSQAGAYYRAYADLDEFNLGVLTLRTGPVWTVPRRWRAGVALQGDQVWLDDRRLAWFSTLNPSLGWNLDPRTEISLDAVLTRRHYQESDDRGRRGWYQAVTLAADRSVRDGRLALQAGLGYAWFDASDRRFAYRSPEVFAGAAISAWGNGTVYARAGWRGYDFRGEEPLFLLSRDEDELRLVLGFEHRWDAGPLQGWALQGSWLWTDNDSNVALYDYRRSQLSLGLARQF